MSGKVVATDDLKSLGLGSVSCREMILSSFQLCQAPIALSSEAL